MCRMFFSYSHALLLARLWTMVHIVSTEMPFRNPSHTIEHRLNDLLDRLTVEELIEQVSSGGAGPKHGPTPKIERLVIDPYQWRTNPGDGDATSFPLPINLAATFDVDTVHQVALATGLEMRAKWNRYKSEHSYESTEYDVNPVRKHVILIASDCKHFAVHTGPEDYPESRFSFEAKVSERDVWLTYLPAFRACLEAGAVSVMCAYSGINGTPDCVNRWLLTEILRQQWEFDGFVVTDNGALQFTIWNHHAFHNNSEAALAAVEAGVNLENSVNRGVNVFSALQQLVDEGRVTREELKQMARPLFFTRMLQGEFDPPEMDPYRFLSPEMFVHSPNHRHLAVMATARSLVLLKHRDRLLPLQLDSSLGKPPLKHVAVVGPFATGVDELYGQYHNTRVPQYEVPLSSGLSQLAARLHAHDICQDGGRCTNYSKNGLEFIMAFKDLDLVVITVGTGNKFEAEGMDRHNISLPGTQMDMLVHTLDLASGRGTVHRGSPVPVVLLVFSTGPVEIEPAIADDNVKAIFWCGFPGAHIGEAMARIMLGNSGQPFGPARPLETVHSQSNLVDSKGYWWFPAARLPFTWYRSIENLANITVYEMTNQTYRYLPADCHKGQNTCLIPVLFPFGYGLTYNTDRESNSGFVYSDLIKPSDPIYPNQPVVVYATVTNRGRVACEEVVQCYIQWMQNESVWTNSRFVSDHIRLVGFQRIALKVGEQRRLEFTLWPWEHLSVWSEELDRIVPGRGRIRLSVGGQIPDQVVSVGSNLLVGYINIQTL
ncbi:beta-glucosidase [Paragonimus westermani]|uniref:Beta-glucosidase n=2 Tax=Paragonimus westermani TaxID=34504 RepID=A0A5J4NGK2_9TREM|nr:beta-glucosidase [Paragonimus westermani]